MDEDRRPARFLELLRALVDGEVNFVIVGGVAAVLEGAPVATFDLDIVYSLEEGNVDRLARALDELETSYVDPAGRKLLPDVRRLRGGGHHSSDRATGVWMYPVRQSEIDRSSRTFFPSPGREASRPGGFCPESRGAHQHQGGR